MYHVPVMLSECLEGLNIRPEGIYVDLTFGGGGHSRAILKKLTTGKLIAFDQDDDAKPHAEALKSDNFIFVAANFRYFKKYLKLYGFKEVDGILADLGISSHQIDATERGFSIRGNAILDMRMDKSNPKDAQKVLNQFSEKELVNILEQYGEIPNARKVAIAIVRERAIRPLKETAQLISILEEFAPKGKENKYYAQVFQAIRIEVNEELEALKEMLLSTQDVIKKGGRLVIMSYHSLEDRLVKNYMRSGKFEGETEKDFYGNVIRPFKPLPSQPITASIEELNVNNRARSAKLRIADKL
ncbi:MAG: 16S rRNA (cytosine(1402)-N(4))-methyltransferase RsmH [Flammeovirgaceae bacterium]